MMDDGKPPPMWFQLAVAAGALAVGAVLATLLTID